MTAPDTCHITGCRDCPSLHGACCYLAVLRDVRDVGSGASLCERTPSVPSTPPAWCPLRRGPMLLVLG